MKTTCLYRLLSDCPLSGRYKSVALFILAKEAFVQRILYIPGKAT